MKKIDYRKLTTLFKALLDENRLKMLAHVCSCKESNVNVGSFASCCDIDFSVVSRHLSKLKSAGVFRSKKKGKEVFYDLEGKELAKQLRALADFIESSNKCC